MFRRLLASWGAQHRLPVRPARRLRLEHLEGREVPTVTLASIPDQPITNNAPIYLPVTVTNTPNGPVAYDVATDNPAVTPSVVLDGRSVRFTVTGKNPDGTDFTGDMVIRLFETQAPLATGRIIQLATSGYYTGKLFHRISGGFTGATDTIIQAGSQNGNGTGGSGLAELPDEYNADFRFNSPGVVASANRGDDTTDQQFFVVRPTTPLATRPQFLNFNYTVLGILTAGADVYERVNATPKNGSEPLNPVTITAATVFSDPNNAVVRLTTQAGFTGTTRLTVTPRDNDGPSAAVSASLTGTTAASGQGERAFLGSIPPNLSTAAGVPVTFSIPFTDVDGTAVVFDVRDASFAAAPANVTVSINQAAGTATLTPAAGFSGVINLRVGVRDNTDRSGSGNVGAASNFDTQALTLTVTPAGSTPASSVSLAVNPRAVRTGEQVTLTATVTAPGTTSTAGTVEFRSGGTLLATAAVSGGTASTVQTFAAAGTQSLTATFVPADAQVVTGSTSPAATVDVTASSTAQLSTTTLTASTTTPTAGQSVTLAATVQLTGGTGTVAGSIRFLNGDTVLATVPVTGTAGSGVGTASTATTFSVAGAQTLTAQFVPTDATAQAASTSQPVTVTVSATVPPDDGDGTTPPPPLTAGVTAEGARAGSAPRVVVRNADGTERVSFLAYEESFTGGVRTAVADVTGDGQPDIVVVPGFGGSPIIKVFDATTGAMTKMLMVFEDSFRGGLTLATGDTGSLGYQRVLVGAGEGGGPRVTLYDFRDNKSVLNYFAYDSALRGGVSVAFGALPRGTGADIVTGVGAGGGPQVNVYDGATGTLLGSTQVGDVNDRNGIGVRVADNPDGTGMAIFVNRRIGNTTAEEIIDTGFVNFDALTEAEEQRRIQELLNPTTRF